MRHRIAASVMIGLVMVLGIISTPGATAIVLSMGEDADSEWETIIENKTFSDGLTIQGKNRVLVRNCQIRGKGVFISNSEQVTILNCQIQHIGGPGISGYYSEDLLPKNTPDHPQLRHNASERRNGILIMNSSDITIHGCEIFDVFGQGILAVLRQNENIKNITISENRIAYIWDDGILIQSSDPLQSPPQGVVIRNNVIHDIGLGLTQLGFARHGMYLKARDVLVEGNTIYNCFYGQGISLRNAGIVRNNKIWNTYSSSIAYWPQTNTEDSSKTVVIEENQCRRDFFYTLPMRHIDHLDSPLKHVNQKPLILVAYAENDRPYAFIEKYIVRNNTVIVGIDYLQDTDLIGSYVYESGKIDGQQLVIENNTVIDLRQ